MSEAMRLAEAYADAVAAHRLESLYGTSKSYTIEKARERDEAHEAMAAELRRLSAELEECQAQRRAAFRRIEEQDKELEDLKKAIGEPVATVQCIHGVTIGYMEVAQPIGSPLYALTKDQS